MNQRALFDFRPVSSGTPARGECAHAVKFPNRNLFEPSQVDEVCADCGATLRTYQEAGSSATAGR